MTYGRAEPISQGSFYILPNELMLQIIDSMDWQDAINFMQVDKQLNQLAKDSRVWKQFGAEDFADFFRHMKVLDGRSRKVIINNNMTFKTHYDLIQINESIDERSLDVSEIRRKLYQINPLFSKYTNQEYFLLKEILDGNTTFSAIDLIPSFKLYIIMARSYWQEALKEGLITFDEALLMAPNHLAPLITQYGFEALKEQLITKEQALLIAPEYLILLLTEPGLNALRAQAINLSELITAKQANEYGVDPYLMEMLTPNGLELLKNKVMSIEDAYLFHLDFLKPIISRNGINALVNNIITLKQLYEAEEDLSADNLMQVFYRDEFYKLLQDKIIIFEQILNLPNKNFLNIICPGGDNHYEARCARNALRAKVLTFEELYELVMLKNPHNWSSLLQVDPKCYQQKLLNFDVAAELASNDKLNQFRNAFERVDKLNKRDINLLESIWSNNEGKEYKSRIISMLKDYTKGSIWGRFFTGHWNRHFVTEVSNIVRNATNVNVSATDILNQVVAINTDKRPNSILRKMSDFMQVKYVEGLTKANIAEKQQSHANTNPRHN